MNSKMSGGLVRVWAVGALFALGCDSGAMVGSRDAGDGGRPSAQPLDECGNGLDDDGDGHIDEDCFCGNGESQDCFPNGSLGACGAGTMGCDAEGSIEWGRWGECEGAPSPMEEVCEGSVDEDCDGAIDEGCPCTDGDTLRCGGDIPTLSGPCQPGEQICRGGEWSGCEGAVLPAPEVCGNGIDDDCDGTVDDPSLCDCRPAPELCGNGIDDDCDGVVDEPDACSSSCVPTAETCGDGVDDDCDARVDEGCGTSDGGTLDGGPPPPDAGPSDAATQPCDETLGPDALSMITASTVGGPSARIGEARHWTGEYLFVWGGQPPTATEVLGDGALYDPAADSWTPTNSSGAPTPRRDAVVASAGGTKIFVWGGARFTLPAVLRDGGVYDLATDTWQRIPSGGPSPPSMDNMVGAWTGSEVTTARTPDDVALFDPEAMRWRFASLFPGDLGQLYGRPVWTGDGWLFPAEYNYRRAGAPADAAPTESPPWWYYSATEDRWLMVPGRPYLAPMPAQTVGQEVVRPLADGRHVAVMGSRIVSPPPEGQASTRDDVFLLDLHTKTWSLAYEGTLQAVVRACVRCDVAPFCRGCPSTASYTDWRNNYWSADLLGCGVIATRGRKLSGPMEGGPDIAWFSSREMSSRTLVPYPSSSPFSTPTYRSITYFSFSLRLGDVGWAMNGRRAQPAYDLVILKIR